MSYILDALKRADAERSRGAVPGLLSPQIGSPLLNVDRAIAGRGWWLGAAALVLTSLAVGLWVWRTPSTGEGQAPGQGAVVAGSTTVLTLPKAGVAAAPPPPTPDAVAAALPTASTTPRPSPAALASAPLPQRATPVMRPSSSSLPTQMAASTPARASTAVTKDEPAPAVSAGVPLLIELPEDLRRQIPALNITGVVYSENPGQRLLLVNNQVLTQGSAVAPELTLEEIQPRSSVLSFRGTRFRVGH